MCFYLSGFSQNPDKILLDSLYMGSMDKVLDAISLKFGVRFIYDKELISSYDIDERPMKKRLSLFLSQECASRKLKWSLTSDSAIFITEKYVTLTSKPVAVEEKRVKRYTGPISKSNFILTGIVRDKSTGEGLPFANIGIRGSSVGTFANSDGFFTLLKVPSDTSTIIISYIGYKTGYVFLSPSTPANNLLIEMELQLQNLQEITVSAEQDRLMIANDRISLLKITPQKLSTLPNIGEKDVIRSFQLLPGVSAANESSSNLFVRGGTPDQNLLLYDGFTVYQVDHLYGFFSAFNSNAIKDVQLYKGGFDAKYGGRLSSVTEITGKDGNSKNFTLGGEISLLSFNVYAEIPIGKRFTSLIAFRRSYQGLLYDKIFKQFNNTSEIKQVSFGGNGGPMKGAPSTNTEVKSYFYDMNVKLTYKPSRNDVMSLSFYDGTDNLDNSLNVSGGGGFGFNINNSDKTNYGNVGFGFRWTRNWNSHLNGTTLISYSNYFSNRNRSNSGSSSDQGSKMAFNSGINENNDLTDLSLKSDYIYNMGHNNQFGFGIFATQYFINYNFTWADTNNIIDKSQNGSISGLYLQDKIKLFKSKLTITPGLRYSYFSPTGKIYPEPRLALTFNLTKNFKIVAETGKYLQFANRVTREDFLSGSRDFWILSDNNKIPVSSAWHYISGISYENKTILASVEGYYKAIDGVTEYSLRFKPAKEGTGYTENFFSGTGYAMGVEFLLQKKYGDFTGWIGYSISKAMNKIAEYGTDYFPASQDVRHEFKLVGLYDYKNWSFSLTWLYASGRPYTSPNGAYTINLIDGTQQTYIDFSSKNTSRLPAYHRLDIGINYHLKDRETKYEWGMIGISVFNLYNRKNVWYKEYQIIDNSVIETNKLFLGITPNLTFSIKFH